MKKNLLILASVTTLLIGGISSGHAEGKIATIDLRKVFDGYWKTKEADSSLKDKAAEMEKEFKTLTEDYKKAKDEYVKLSTLATDQAVASEERDKRKKAAEAKLLEIRESEQTIDGFRRQSTTTLEEKKRMMRDKILAEIKNLVNARAKSGGYSLIMDTAAESLNSTPVLVFSSGENDITDDVLKQLNASAPAGALKGEDAK